MNKFSIILFVSLGIFSSISHAEKTGWFPFNISLLPSFTFSNAFSAIAWPTLAVSNDPKIRALIGGILWSEGLLRLVCVGSKALELHINKKYNLPKPLSYSTEQRKLMVRHGIKGAIHTIIGGIVTYQALVKLDKSTLLK